MASELQQQPLRRIDKAAPGDYPAYAEMYMKWLPNDGMVLNHLEANFHAVKRFIYGLPPQKLLYRYRPGKWSIKEILVHIIDDERIFSYRALRFARGSNYISLGLTRIVTQRTRRQICATWTASLKNTGLCGGQRLPFLKDCPKRVLTVWAMAPARLTMPP
jgi:hypothetical protein